MLWSTDFWMSLAGVVYFIAGAFVFRKELRAARGWDRLIAWSVVFVAVPLAVFAPEHFRGPEFVQNMVPSYMPMRSFWAYFVGCALLAAATSLTVRKFERASSILLGLMFFLFVCMIYLPSTIAHYKSRFAWAYMLRDLSFAAGAWALAGRYCRVPSLVLFARLVIAAAAIVFGVHHFLHPDFAPGVPLEMKMPSWVPMPSVWGYLAGAILLGSGIGLALNKYPRIAAAWIGALMTACTLFLYMVVLILSIGTPGYNDALNYVADTLLYAGAALALAAALPSEVR